MDNLSKNELLRVIKRQESDLARYKSRLTDLVAAHKHLMKEKEVLETSIKALTQASSKNSDDEMPNMSEASSEGNQNEVEESVDQLKVQLTTLMNSIATLSEEKNRMEASFQADKRILRNDKQQLENQLKELHSKLDNEVKNHHSEMENFKSKLIVERHERDKEHADHRVMIRELQKLVAEERGRREKAETELKSAKNELLSAKEAKETIERDAEVIKEKLERLENRCKEDQESSGAIATRLEQELSHLKLHHLITSRQEQERVAEAEERARQIASANEERVANLEARLAELSLTVGTYDRLRQQDQLAIDKLKERILQLEVEHGEEKTDISADGLIHKLQDLKQMMEKLNQTAEKPFDIKALFMESFQYDNDEDAHKACRCELDLLREEFEQYKKQVQINQRSHSPIFRLDNTDNENEALKEKIKNLQTRMRGLIDQIEQMEAKHSEELDSQKQVLLQEKNKFKEKLSVVENEWRIKVSNLEVQLAKQRERALALVRDKEQEITILKESFHTLIPVPRKLSTCEKEEERIDSESAGANFSGVGGPMLHYSQEVARKDVELSRLRKEKHKLESELREAVREMELFKNKTEQLQTALQHQLQRFERCQSQEGSNLEYLKNVVLSFLLSNDPSCKVHMLNAIAAVLKFTDSERSKIRQQSWWYNRTNVSTKPTQ